MADTPKTVMTRRSEPRVLGIYLNDHLAGATAATELARRVAASHQGQGESGPLERLADEVAEDRASLLQIMAALGIPVRAYKVGAAWIGEKAGRLKFNGYLLGRSPLSSLEELEMLRLGVEGKAAGWRTLRVLADTDARLDPGDIDELIDRARRQGEMLEELRAGAANRIINLERTGNGQL
jgi:hypothetical protein